MSPAAASCVVHAVAAALSVVVARRRSDYRHVAGFLVATALADAGRSLARETSVDLSSAVAFTGWHRAAIHVDRAAYLLWPAALAWMSTSTFGDQAAPMRKRAACIVGAWVAAVALLVAMYPVHRQEDTSHAMVAAELASMFFAVGSIVQWWRRRVTPTLASGVAGLIVGIHAAAFVVVARGYTVDRWRLAVGSYLVLYVVVVFVQGGVLWTSSLLESKSPRS